MGKKAFLYSFFFACFAFVFLFDGQDFCFSTISSGSDISKEFYYFNPDSPQSNLGHLKQEFETYFSANNFPFTFQPFTHFIDFHRLNSERKPAFVLMPEWYYRKYGKALGLHPLLVPVRNGSTTYKKILLISKAQVAARNDYEIISFAMTFMGPDEEASGLKKMVAEEHVSIEQLNIVNVPKDLDAILALVLGQVKMALVCQDNLHVMSDVNPRITQTIKNLNKSITVPMPVLCYVEGRAGAMDVKSLLETFKKMTDAQPKNKIMEMLQIDGWQNFTQ